MTVHDGSPALPCFVACLLAIGMIATGVAFLPPITAEGVEPSVVHRLAETVIGKLIAVAGLTALLYGLIELSVLRREARVGVSPAGLLGHASGRGGAPVSGDALEAAMARRAGPLMYAAWSLPLLGFIGTVLGLSEAIGGLGGVFDGTSDRDAALSGVLLNLRFAFDTTLAGLVLVLPVMALLSAVQGRASRITAS